MLDIAYSLVIPCYNELGNLPTLVHRCRTLLEERDDIEVILVDNGSLDETPTILKDLLVDSGGGRLRTIRVDVNQGYGFGILSGLRVCKGGVLGWTHADLQTDPLDFLRAIKLFADANDSKVIFAKGSRYARPFRDVVFTWGMAVFESLILGVRMWDINAQPTVFSREFYMSWEKPPKDFSLDLYVYRMAVHKRLKIRRFPVNFEARLSGKGHNEALSSKLRYSWKTIRFSYKLRKHLKAIMENDR